MWFKDHLSRTIEDSRKYLIKHLPLEIIIIFGVTIASYVLGDEINELLNAFGVAILSIIVIIVGVFLYNLILAPKRIYNENSEIITTLEERNKELSTPLIKIEHNDNYHFEPNPYMSDREKFQREMEEEHGKFSDDWRLCRIRIHNSSLNVKVENVEVRLTEIIPNVPALNDKLPIILRFKDGNSNINAKGKEFVDVVEWVLDPNPELHTYYCICGINRDVPFPITKENYKIKIEVTSENALGESGYFYFSMKNKDNTHNKIWLEQTKA